MLKILKSKIHGAIVTMANLNYTGSITIDRILMDQAKLLPNECVLVADFNNGNRFETYVIEGKPGSGIICLNGPSAHLVSEGDRVAILAFTYLPESDARQYKPPVVVVDHNNRVTEVK